jgi:hypothetical protein
VLLHGDIKNDEEEVYMEIPRDFGLTGRANNVCRLKKSAKTIPLGMIWKIHKAMVYLDYKQS